MEITSAEFVISNTDVKKCPAGIFPEYAFIGRSNVGKSSLINMLTARKGLAMTSATPGKTMLINHFLINKNWYLVDLPGYGYARRGQKGKDQIRTIIEDYILEREQMTNLFVLIDSRLEPQNIDLEFMEWLGENGINTNAEFVISNTDVKKCPAGIFPEYAFIGRSNVGKSSLINMLTARKGLAMTSATPGKTMLINHFLINKNWYLVDLPGYGYARRGQKGKDQIRTIIEDYILEREQMTNLFVLIDSRLEPQNIDLEFMEWLGENGIPFSIIFTKADKLKGGRLKMNINAYLRELSKQWEELPPYFISSSENRTGRTEILNYIENINKEINYK